MSENDEDGLRDAEPYERIYAIIECIPRGHVATYGQIAAIEGRATARMVGYALAALKGRDRPVPWQRVLNSAGQLSERKGGGGTSRQRRLLEEEGVLFDHRGRIDFDEAGWDGPDFEWLEQHDFQPARRPENRGRRR